MNDEVLLAAITAANESIAGLREDIKAGRERIDQRIDDSEKVQEALAKSNAKLRALLIGVGAVAVISLLAAVGSFIGFRRTCQYGSNFQTAHNDLVLSFQTTLVSARDQTLASKGLSDEAKADALKFYDEQINNLNHNKLVVNDCGLVATFTG